MSALIDGHTAHGHMSDSHNLDVSTTPRDRRFKRRLTSFVRDALQTTLDTHAEAYGAETSTTTPVPTRSTNIHALADDAFAAGQGPAFLCSNGEADENHLAKADQRIGRALNKASQRLSQPGRDESTAPAPTDGSEHAASKYKNIDSLLRYVEADSGQGAVKVVIMNFND